MKKNVATTPAVEERGAPSVRERILETAATLFYQEGVRAAGVDLVVERSGVAKTSLYRHFATKDDLVVAFLEREDAEYWSDWESVSGKVAAQGKEGARAELEAHLRFIAHHIAEPKYRGCPFLNVATEFPEPTHPARVVALQNKAELHRRLDVLAKKMGVRKHGLLADQLVLLIDGAYMNSQLLGNKASAHPLVVAGLALMLAAEQR